MPDGQYPRPTFRDLDLDGIGAVSTSFVLVAQGGAPFGYATLDGSGRVPSSQMSGASKLLGTWNASTNTPTLGDSGAGGVQGDYYIVATPGSTSIDGINSWALNDWIVRGTSAWTKQPNSGLPTSTLNAADGSKVQGGTPMMPDLAWWRRDTAGNIAEAHDVTGLKLIHRLQVTGAATFPASTFAGTQTVTGDVDVSGAGSFGGQVGVGSILYPTGDVVQAGGLMPDLARWTRDPDGNIVDGFGTDGTRIFNNVQIVGTLTAPNFAGGGGDDPTKFSASLISARDGQAVAMSMAVRTETNSQIAQPIWNLNHVIAYGQSLSVGNQGNPRISTAEGLDNLCFGTQPAGNMTTTDYTFIPFTDGHFHTLDGPSGFEMPSLGAINQWRALQLRWRGMASDSTRQLVLSNCSEGGKAIEELSKGYAPSPYYNRILSLVTQAQTEAVATGKTYGVVAVPYIQGEANYGGSWDHTTAGYKAKLDQLRSDISTDIMAITGQTFPPMFITIQTSSVWDGGIDQCTIGMAQLLAGVASPPTEYMSGPNQQAPASNPFGGHKCNDGYRWIGESTGHIMHKVIDRGEGWLPCYPTAATYRGKQILLQCHVPVPPLQSQAFYAGATGNVPQPIFSDLGFRAGDDFGTLNITAVTLYDAVILIEVDRATDIAQHPWVQYADQTVHNGNGNVCDSDNFVSLDLVSAGVPTLTGQPYPMWNWLVAFRINVTSDV